MIIWRVLFLAILLCGAMACSPGGSSPPDDNHNTGGAGGDTSNPPTGGSGGKHDGSAGGSDSAGGAGGSGGDVGGEGGGSLPPDPCEECTNDQVCSDDECVPPQMVDPAFQEFVANAVGTWKLDGTDLESQVTHAGDRLEGFPVLNDLELASITVDGHFEKDGGDGLVVKGDFEFPNATYLTYRAYQDGIPISDGTSRLDHIR